MLLERTRAHTSIYPLLGPLMISCSLENNSVLTHHCDGQLRFRSRSRRHDHVEVQAILVGKNALRNCPTVRQKLDHCRGEVAWEGYRRACLLNALVSEDSGVDCSMVWGDSLRKAETQLSNSVP